MRASVLVALAGVAGWASVAGAAGVADVTPADALAVLHVNNLGRVSDKMANLSRQLGLAEMSPQMADPLGTLQAKLGITKGVDKAGDLAFAFLDPATYGSDPDKSIVLLVPVSDYKAFAAQ
ncbi:MAG TPA: hypothetical protein VK324_06410, partial [Tepidisphaeraceae bacterium]|nr:hypothetical protein [Tepidisphaeraceae bacterium]